MIDWLDLMLRDLLTARVAFLDTDPPTGVDPEQVGFQPPDTKWKSFADTFAPKRALNVYLIDVRENRELRSNERGRELNGGVVIEHPAPHRLDCHYLISAWSPATEADGKTIDEHRLLYEAAAVLLEHRPLVAEDVYGPGGLPANFPSLLADHELPTVTASPSGFLKLPEFWGTMEKQQWWRPTVALVVTIPVLAAPDPAGPPVTTLFGTYGVRTNGGIGAAETLIDIGGRVLVDTTGEPVEDALVRVLDGAALIAEVQTDSEGRFRFDRLQSGSYDLEAGALGVGSDTKTTAVPSPTGDYDLRLN